MKYTHGAESAGVGQGGLVGEKHAGQNHTISGCGSIAALGAGPDILLE